eukprot:410447-Pelagomonas_calceolata.AAC.4
MNLPLVAGGAGAGPLSLVAVPCNCASLKAAVAGLELSKPAVSRFDWRPFASVGCNLEPSSSSRTGLGDNGASVVGGWGRRGACGGVLTLLVLVLVLVLNTEGRLIPNGIGIGGMVAGAGVVSVAVLAVVVERALTEARGEIKEAARLPGTVGLGLETGPKMEGSSVLKCR